MPLVNTKEMFKKAYEGGYAIGAFNVNNMEIVQGIIAACKELNSPVILQVSGGARKYAHHAYLYNMVKAAEAKKLCAIADSSVSAYPSINPSDILDLQIVLPKYLDETDELVSTLSSLLSAKAHWQDENRQLLSLRNWLLPMLMNGQATVTE